jgi:sortase (surface protein transpeptidase)
MKMKNFVALGITAGMSNIASASSFTHHNYLLIDIAALFVGVAAAHLIIEAEHKMKSKKFEKEQKQSEKEPEQSNFQTRIQNLRNQSMDSDYVKSTHPKKSHI